MRIKQIVKYGLDTCGPCKNQEKILEEVSKETGVMITFKDCEECEDEELEMFGVRSVPTLVYIDEEGDFITKCGFQTKEQVKTMLV